MAMVIKVTDHEELHDDGCNENVDSDDDSNKDMPLAKLIIIIKMMMIRMMMMTIKMNNQTIYYLLTE